VCGAAQVLLGQRCTEQVDIYSFGVILWCAGQRSASNAIFHLQAKRCFTCEKSRLSLECGSSPGRTRAEARTACRELSVGEAPSGRQLRQLQCAPLSAWHGACSM